MSVLHVRVTGLPAPKGSVTRMPNGAYLQGANKAEREKIRSWSAAVAEAAADAMANNGWKCCDGPIELHVTFMLPVVASDRYRTRHVTKPDLDKLVRNTADALEAAGVFSGDSHVFLIVARKFHTADGWTGAIIAVHDDSEMEALERAGLKDAAAVARREARRAPAPEHPTLV